MKLLPTLARLEVLPCARDLSVLAICEVAPTGARSVISFIHYDQACELLTSLLGSLGGPPDVQQPAAKTTPRLFRR